MGVPPVSACNFQHNLQTPNSVARPQGVLRSRFRGNFGGFEPARPICATREAAGHSEKWDCLLHANLVRSQPVEPLGSSAFRYTIGFHVSYDTRLQFLEWYRELLEEKLQECLEEAVPAPDLDEQVANDPAVKAAKQAYDEAYAKAYAEARKRL